MHSETLSCKTAPSGAVLVSFSWNYHAKWANALFASELPRGVKKKVPDTFISQKAKASANDRGLWTPLVSLAHTGQAWTRQGASRRCFAEIRISACPGRHAAQGTVLVSSMTTITFFVEITGMMLVVTDPLTCSLNAKVRIPYVAGPSGRMKLKYRPHPFCDSAGISFKSPLTPWAIASDVGDYKNNAAARPIEINFHMALHLLCQLERCYYAICIKM